jgi:tripartite-type tricarboxylate transporter receptor subunit TctC
MRVLPMRRRWLGRAFAALLAIAALATAPIGRLLAQDYPNRTIRVIMPLGPGGIGDIFLRALAQELTKTLGQPLVIDNRPGGATLVGSQACAQSPPDGYTLCMLAIDSFSIAPFFNAKLPYDPEKDFAPIVRLFFIGQGLVVHRSLGVDTLADLVALSKAKPGTLSYAAQANQITMVMEDLKRNTGADLQRVPYQAGGQAVSAIIAGQVPVGFLGIGNVLPQVQEGQVKLLAVDGSPLAALSGRADLRRSGLFGADHQALVRTVRAGRHAQADRRARAGRNVAPDAGPGLRRAAPRRARTGTGGDGGRRLRALSCGRPGARQAARRGLGPKTVRERQEAGVHSCEAEVPRLSSSAKADDPVTTGLELEARSAAIAPSPITGCPLSRA